ncbi:LamG domain-containing protein [Candidatus Woesearchaeota archaeon]|nr:LamG domain-containing protein [Candidatus Woesearchaeota archaeon]
MIKSKLFEIAKNYGLVILILIFFFIIIINQFQIYNIKEDLTLLIENSKESFTISEASLVAYWPFDHNSTKDKVGNSDIINHGAQYNYNGKIGGAYYFDGFENYLEVPKGFPIFNIDRGAVSFLVYPELSILPEGHTNGPIIHYRNGGCCNDFLIIRLEKAAEGDYIALYAEVNDSITLRVKTKYPVVKEYSWNYIVINQDGKGVKIYVNGEEKEIEGMNSGDWFASHYPGDHDFSIGERGSWGNNFKGKLDELKIWNRTLSEVEIKSFINQIR